MKKRTQVISSIAKFASVAVLSAGLMTFNSCKKDLNSDIKVEDTEDAEKTNQVVGVAELEEEYAALTQYRTDSFADVLAQLKENHQYTLDELEKTQDLLIEKENHDQDISEEERLFVEELKEAEADARLKVLAAELKAAQNDKDIADIGIEIAKAEATQQQEIDLEIQEAKTALAKEEVLTNAELANVIKSLQDMAKDSVINAYTILSEINGEKQDSVVDHYSLLDAIASELKTYTEDTATYNKELAVSLDDTQKDEVYELLVRANEQIINIQKENDEQEARILDQQLAYQQRLDAAQKAYDDYIASQDEEAANEELIENGEKTELEIVLFSQDPLGNETLITTGATITLNGVELTYDGGSAIAVGDLEGDHFVTIAVADHLTTQFAFNIADDANNDDAATFELYEQRLVVKMLQASNSFTVEGNIVGNTMDYELWSTAFDYDYLEETGVFEQVTPASQLETDIKNAISKQEAEEGTEEPLAGLELSVKVTGTVASGDYVETPKGGITVSSFTMTNTTNLTATTGANGDYTLEGIPVLNDDFVVEIVIANTRIDQDITFYGQDATPEEVTRVVTDNVVLVQGQKITLTPAERENGVKLFKDLDLF